MTYRRARRPAATPGNAPTPAQTIYLSDLIKRSGMTPEEWRDSVGLYEVSPWGKRLRTENITRTAMSRWIDQLKGKIENDQSCPRLLRGDRPGVRAGERLGRDHST